MVDASLASFDIFETVLARKVGSAMSSFYMLGRRLERNGLLDCSVEVFARARADAERRAFANAGGLDSAVDLEAIHRELAFGLGYSNDRVPSLVEHERGLEEELLVAIARSAARLTEVRGTARKVVFLSDMYLSSEFLRAQLDKHGLFEPGDEVRVSNERQKSKLSGALFEELLIDEGISPGDVVHAGNHEWSDVGQPRKLGIRTRPFPEGNPTRYERILDEQVFASQGLTGAMAGASRLARLRAAQETSRERALREVAAGVGAPFVVGYCLWVLRRARELGLARLYFLSRDGLILNDVFNRIAAKLGFDVKGVYLYGSRQAWLLPSLTSGDRADVERVLPRKFDVSLTVRQALARFEVVPESHRDPLERAGLPAATWDQNLSEDRLEALRTLLTEDPGFRSNVTAGAEQRRALLLRYLEQVGFVGPDPVALVDLGTGATLHNALGAVLESAGRGPPKSFYLGMRNVPTGRFGRPEVYMNDAGQGVGFGSAPGLTTTLEAICSANHGTVLGYEDRDGRIEPVLAADDNPAVMAWGYSIVRQTIVDFADYLVVDPELVDPWGDVRPVIERLQKTFWRTPTREEAGAWGAFPMEDGLGREAVYVQLAEPYSPIDALRVVRRVARDGKLLWRRHWWHDGALAMSSPLLREALTASERLSLRVHRLVSKLR